MESNVMFSCVYLRGNEAGLKKVHALKKSIAAGATVLFFY